MGFFGNLYHDEEAEKIGNEFQSKIFNTSISIKKFIEDPNEKYDYEGHEEGWGFNLDLKDKDNKIPPINWITVNGLLTFMSMKIITSEATKENKSESYKEAVINKLFKKMAEKLNLNSSGFSQQVVEKYAPQYLGNLGVVAQSGPLGILSSEYDIEIEAASHTITENLFKGNINFYVYKDYSKERYNRHYEETCKRIYDIIRSSF
jgi:hypothetical protein